MFDLLLFIPIIGSIVCAIKTAMQPAIPAENWANTELYHEDIMKGIPHEQIMKNVENGKYKLTRTYPQPHKDPVDGKIIIENSKLYFEDVSKYGAYKAGQWVKQGKYNLTKEEMEIENKRIKEYYNNLTKKTI